MQAWACVLPEVVFGSIVPRLPGRLHILLGRVC
jgi:hypothetical protein